MKNLLLIIFITLSVLAEDSIRVRPNTWAQKVIGSDLENFYKIDNKLYRSEQPDDDDMKVLEKFGIKNLLNLRHYHTDNDEAEGTKLNLIHIPLKAHKLTYDDIVKSMKAIKDAKGPVLVHCWHGSDRTGTMVAAYRIVFQNWSKDQALDELKNGGYGFHETFKNIPKLIKGLDEEKLRKDVLEK